MPRPRKCRYIQDEPGIKKFKPAGIPGAGLQEVTLAVDEYEAIRLADLESHSHEEAAAHMGVSRATFGRIVEKARHKVADTLINGKSLTISGGDYIERRNIKDEAKECGKSRKGKGRKNMKCGRCGKEILNHGGSSAG